jgi:putative SOS response-associated peptidase YedK
MCYSNSSTSKNIDLAKKYKKKIPVNMDEKPLFIASGFTFPQWRIVTKNPSLEDMQWGLVPSWFNGEDVKEIAALTLNAKVETLDEKVSFKHLLHRQECIVPSSGFFEWKTVGKEKIPYFVYPTTDFVFSMAGLYDHWIDPISGIIRKTFTIITCPANDLMAEIHNSKKRMPVLLKPEQETNWLDGKLNLEELKQPVESSFLKAHEVNKKLLAAKNCNSPDVQKPYHTAIYEQGSLF